MKQYHILKSDSHLNLALMLLRYIVPHLKSESSLKITRYTPLIKLLSSLKSHSSLKYTFMSAVFVDNPPLCLLLLRDPIK